MLTEIDDVPATVQAVEATATVTADDYERVLAPLVERARRTGSRMRLLYHFGPGFDRITAGALWADARLGMHYVRLLDGCAVVTDIGWIRTPADRMSTFMPCPVRVYGDDESDDAIEWLTSLPECSNVSARDMAKAYIGGVGGALRGLGELAVHNGAGIRDRLQ